MRRASSDAVEKLRELCANSRDIEAAARRMDLEELDRLVGRRRHVFDEIRAIAADNVGAELRPLAEEADALARRSVVAVEACMGRLAGDLEEARTGRRTARGYRGASRLPEGVPVALDQRR